MLTKTPTLTTSVWRVPRDWVGETCFVLCGGPSVGDLDLSRLAGRRVIAVNTSMFTYPLADYGVFADKHWWTRWQQRAKAQFCGRVVALTPMRPSPDYLLLERCRMGGVASDPRHLAIWHTVATPAVNLAVHLGARTINFLGLDGCDRDGRQWHHEDHPSDWHRNAHRYDYHREAMEHVAVALERLGVKAFNSNPHAAHRMFPHKPFEEMLA